jgi:hypothetical protein
MDSHSSQIGLIGLPVVLLAAADAQALNTEAAELIGRTGEETLG